MGEARIGDKKGVGRDRKLRCIEGLQGPDPQPSSPEKGGRDLESYANSM